MPKSVAPVRVPKLYLVLIRSWIVITIVLLLTSKLRHFICISVPNRSLMMLSVLDIFKSGHAVLSVWGQPIFRPCVSAPTKKLARVRHTTVQRYKNVIMYTAACHHFDFFRFFEQNSSHKVQKNQFVWSLLGENRQHKRGRFNSRLGFQRLLPKNISRNASQAEAFREKTPVTIGPFFLVN